MKNEFPVVELFDSIDGEGKRTGLMAIFVRFAGCNLRCTYRLRAEKKRCAGSSYGRRTAETDSQLSMEADYFHRRRTDAAESSPPLPDSVR